MPVESRLRQGFRRNADALEPDVERFLSTVLDRARRRQLPSSDGGMRRGRCRGSPCCLRLPGRGRDAQLKARAPRDPHQAKTAGPQGLTGTFQGRLWPGLDAVRVDRMTGQWAIVINPDGTMTVQAPSTFVGVLGGYRFQPRGSGSAPTYSRTTSADAFRGEGHMVTLWERSDLRGRS